MPTDSSKYLEFYTKVGDKGICKGCGDEMSWGGTTSGLKNHLTTRRHKEKTKARAAAMKKSEKNNRRTEKTKQRASEEDKETDDKEDQREGVDGTLDGEQDQSRSRSQRAVSPTVSDNDISDYQPQGRSRKRNVSSRSFRMSTPRRDESPFFNGYEFRSRKRRREASEPGPSRSGYGSTRREPGPSRRTDEYVDDFDYYDNISYRESQPIREDSHPPQRADSQQRVVPRQNFLNFDMDEKDPEKENKTILKLVLKRAMPISLFLESGLRDIFSRLNSGYTFPTKEVLLSEVLPSVALEIRDEIKNKLAIAEKLSISIYAQPSPNDSKKKIVAIYAFFTHPTTLKPYKIHIHYTVTKDADEAVRRCLEKLRAEEDPEEGVKKIRFLTENLSPVEDSFDQVTENENIRAALKLPCLNHLLAEIFGRFSSFAHGCEWMNVIPVQKRIFVKHLLDLGETDVRKLVIENQSWKEHNEFLKQVLEIYSKKPEENKKYWFTDDQHKVTFLMKTLYEEVEGSLESFRSEGGYLLASSIIPIIKCLIAKVEALKFAYIAQRQWLEYHLPSIIEIYRKCCIHDTLRLATFLDPRFKNVYFTEEFIVTKEYLEGDVKPPKSKTVEVPTASEKVAQDPKWSGSKMIISKHQKKTPPLGSIENEMVLYHHLPLTEGSTPSDFWKMQENNLPILSNMDKNYLHLPAMATGAEELFAVGQLMLPIEGPNRKQHEMLVFCSGNKDLIRNE